MLPWLMELDISPTEMDSISHLRPLFYDCIIFGNDYWSWPKELAEAGGQKTKAMNTMSILLRSAEINEGDALEVLKQRTIEAEREFLQACTDFLSSSCSPAPSSHLKRYLEGQIWLISGFSIWSASSPRYSRDDLDEIERAACLVSSKWDAT